MKKRVFILHGWAGVAEAGWRGWLKKELEQKDFDVSVPQMPNPENPIQEEWISLLSSIVQTPDENCYFVGHSLGVITILRYIESLHGNEKIGGCVFVSGFTDNKIGKLQEIWQVASFFQTEVDFEKVKKHCKKFVAICSDNDPYVSLEYGKILKEELGAETIILHNMQHISPADGVNELPIVLESILKLSQ